jgi:hypothetical protein
MQPIVFNSSSNDIAFLPNQNEMKLSQHSSTETTKKVQSQKQRKKFKLPQIVQSEISVKIPTSFLFPSKSNVSSSLT